jgi:hypothetical protein
MPTRVMSAAKNVFNNANWLLRLRGGGECLVQSQKGLADRVVHDDHSHSICTTRTKKLAHGSEKHRSDT